MTTNSPNSARRLLLLDPYLAARAGHHFEFAEDVVAAARSLGLQPRVFAHRRFRESAVQGAPACGTFREKLWQRTLAGLALQLLGRGERLGLSSVQRRLSEAFDRRRENQFAQDVIHALRQAEPRPGDLAFLPNMTHVETFGLARAFRTEPDLTRRVSWHLEYHYPPAQGRDNEHRAASDDECLTRRALAALEQSRCGQRAYCYTDTDELTLQYRNLGVCDFQTLPIPVSPKLHAPVAVPLSGGDMNDAGRSGGTVQRPLTVVYLGDSRTEKGFELLPDVIRDLWPDLLATGRLRFVIQSLINRRWKQRSLVRTQQALRRFPPPAVQLIERPLGGDEYRDIVRSGQIMLLPYARASYAARSSGILAEALAAGLPAIVPAQSWLSGQLEQSARSNPYGSGNSDDDKPVPNHPPRMPGLIYSGGASQIAQALRQLAANYETFQKLAMDHAAGWSAFHNPRRLLELLLQREAKSAADSSGATLEFSRPRQAAASAA
jgi:hypothetical protein